MARQHDLDAHFDSALHYRVEVIHPEPEQHTIALGSVGAIADGAVMMLDLKAVQLQDEASHPSPVPHIACRREPRDSSAAANTTGCWLRPP
jgi:hypothetical protein